MKKDYNYLRTKSNVVVDKNSYSFYRIFYIIFLVILIMCTIRYTFTNSTITFTSFLEFLQNCPSIELPKSFINNLSITESWGLFDFLRNFFNSLGTILGTLIWLIANLLNGIVFIFYFIGFVFGV